MYPLHYFLRVIECYADVHSSLDITKLNSFIFNSFFILLIRKVGRFVKAIDSVWSALDPTS